MICSLQKPKRLKVSSKPSKPQGHLCGRFHRRIHAKPTNNALSLRLLGRNKRRPLLVFRRRSSKSVAQPAAVPAEDPTKPVNPAKRAGAEAKAPASVQTVPSPSGDESSKPAPAGKATSAEAYVDLSATSPFKTFGLSRGKT